MLEPTVFNATAGVCGICLIIGVQIIFYTKSFEEEYRDKIEIIRNVIDGKLNKKIGDLCKSHSRLNLDMGAVGESEKIFPEFGEDLKQHLLEEVVDVALDSNEWAMKLSEGKKYLRKLGVSIIAFGSLTLIAGLFSLFDSSIIATIALEGAAIAFILIIFGILKYRDLLKLLDNYYTDIERGIVSYKEEK